MDTRQKAGKHDLKHAQMIACGAELIHKKMDYGDYCLDGDSRICIDTKQDLQEVVGNVITDHKRFVAELSGAQENGIKLVILVEHSAHIKSLEDVCKWKNPRLRTSPRATTGKTLYKILKTLQEKHGCEFMFCSKRETGYKIMEILTGNTYAPQKGFTNI